MVSWKSSSVSVGNPQIISVAMVTPGTLRDKKIWITHPHNKIIVMHKFQCYGHVTLCPLVDRHQHFGGMYRFHLHGQSETMTTSIYQTTCHHIPEDRNLNTHCYEDLKCDWQIISQKTRVHISPVETESKQEVLGRTNRLLSMIRHGQHWKRRIRQSFYCCVCIRYHGNVSTEPLPSNDRGIFTEPSLSNDKGIFTEPLPSNDMGETQALARTQTAMWSHKPTLVFQNKESRLKTEKL
jgi:hypothetical protein